MTYDARERSRDKGEPVELYTFMLESRAWNLTSADRPQALGGVTFAPAVITRNRIEQGTELNRSALKLTVPRDFPIAELYRIAPPSAVVAVIVRRLHVGDGEVATIWTGRVVNVAWGNDLATATITCETAGTSLRRTGLRRLYGRNCSHVLGGPACGVNLPAFSVAGTLTAVGPATVTAAAFATKPDGYFAGGVLTYSAGGVTERRYIVEHAGTTLTLDRRTPGLEVAAVAQAMPGCDHTLATCNAKFANAPNYGGQPFIPQKNPFSGDPIY